jgi:hypothetical protein
MKFLLTPFRNPRRCRILCYFNHYFGSTSAFIGKSTSSECATRAEIVLRALHALRQLPFAVDLYVCGFKDCSLLPIDIDLSAIGDPQHIVFASIERMFESIEDYDYFLNVEDDILLDSDVFESVFAFNRVSQPSEVLLPNRMELNPDGTSYCVDLVAMPGWKGLVRTFGGMSLDIANNPHSGLMLLSRAQMRYAKARVDLSRRMQIIGGPMASAFANVHVPFLMWRTKSDLEAHKVIHLDRWLHSPGVSTSEEAADARADCSTAKPTLSTASGYIDAVNFEGLFCTLSGWAIDTSGAPLTLHVIQLDNHCVTTFRTNRFPRPDVVEAYPHAHPDSGFELTFSLLGLPEEAIDSSSLVIVGRDAATDVAVTPVPAAVWPVTGVRQAIASAPQIPDSPFMPDPAVRRLSALLEQANCYLEYGTGGSTMLARRIRVPHVIGVDSDKSWLEALRYKARALGGDEFLELIHIDIGPTGNWGYPTSESGWRNYVNYPLAPWMPTGRRHAQPDVILIDGRFRVACFLASILHGRPGVRILFDDYLDRPHYGVVERFVRPQQQHDRVAEFVVPSGVPDRDLWHALLASIADAR